jgi:hypothetical protein
LVIDELQAGPELDRLVAEEVMGWTIYDDGGEPHRWLGGDGLLTGWALDEWSDGYFDEYSPHYAGDAPALFTPHGVFRPSVDIAAAWLVFERMTELIFCSSVGNNGNKHAAHIDCRFWNEADGRRGISIARTAPLAICRAALKAIRAIDKT